MENKAFYVDEVNSFLRPGDPGVFLRFIQNVPRYNEEDELKTIQEEIVSVMMSRELASQFCQNLLKNINNSTDNTKEED